MFINNFKYSFLTLFRNKALIFWTFAFPIVLVTFFNLAFSDIEDSEKLSIIDIAIVDNEEFRANDVMKEAFNTLSDVNNSGQLFNTKYVSLDDAKILLDDKGIDGYLLIENNNPKIIVTTSGINQTIFKSVTDEIMETSKVIENLVIMKLEKNESTTINYEQIYHEALEKINNQVVNIVDESSTNLSYMMIEFYTLIAMTCLYGGVLGLVSINNSLANMSTKGMRVSIAPINKGKIILSSLFASYIIQLMGLLILFLYTTFIIKVDYGSNLLLIILLVLCSALAGLSLGVVIGTLIKANDNTKTGILISITMLASFLSGMMGVSMKYIIDKNMPIINKLNPASMITDGFYSLYYYDGLDRYFINIISLLVFALLMIIISYNGLRRQKYDSI